MTPMTPDEFVRALGRAGADPFLARQVLDEVCRRRLRSLVRTARVHQYLHKPMLTVEPTLPGVIEVEGEVFVALKFATRRDLLDAANLACQRYLARREQREYLFRVLFATVAFAPRLDDGQVVGDVAKVAS